MKIFNWQKDSYKFFVTVAAWTKWYADPSKAEDLADEAPTTEQIKEVREAFEDFSWNVHCNVKKNHAKSGKI